MPTIWKKLSAGEIRQRVFAALAENVNYDRQNILGVPASYLDDKVFNQDATFVRDAPFISTLAQNPNHIGCHTLGTSEPFFAGTQALEREALDICAIDILGAGPGRARGSRPFVADAGAGQEAAGAYDGYVASGGTEANLQAAWIYRNYFQNKHGASSDEIAILCTADSHYCVDKAANVFSLAIYKVPVTEADRRATPEAIATTVAAARAAGKQYFIVYATMMTTMFGSVDSVPDFVEALTRAGVRFRIHVDGAYGGFYYPFTTDSREMTFENPHISSFTLDAHKMAQAPYGTGIFLIRKGLIQHANTREARYVAGEDFTLIGSRSGANAVAIWMILVTNGPYGWREKNFILQERASWLAARLTELGVGFYRSPKSNILTIRAAFVGPEVAARFGLVPDDHRSPAWYKVVIMDHVTIEKLIPLVDALKSAV